MTKSQWLGQVLLWTGFLMAALATVSQKEFDLLPVDERASFKQLDEGLVISKAEMLKLTDRPIPEMRTREIVEMVEKLNAWYQERQTELEQLEQQGIKPPAIVHPQKKWDIIARRTAVLDNVWSTVRWPWYGFAMMMGIVGVVLLRSSRVTGTGSGDGARDSYVILVDALNELVDKIGLLKDRFEKLIPEEVIEFIDQQCVLHFNDFADARHTLVQRYGLSGFADIMSDFALGERMLNRAWCASADGYVDEARNSIAQSLEYLNSARQKLRVCEQNKLGGV
jgi:hypothetical protein